MVAILLLLSIECWISSATIELGKCHNLYGNQTFFFKITFIFLMFINYGTRRLELIPWLQFEKPVLTLLFLTFYWFSFWNVYFTLVWAFIFSAVNLAMILSSLVMFLLCSPILRSKNLLVLSWNLYSCKRVTFLWK